MDTKKLENLSMESIEELQGEGFVNIGMNSTCNHLTIYEDRSSLCYYVGHVTHYNEEKQRGWMSEISEVFAYKKGPIYVAETILRRLNGSALKRKTIGYCFTRDGANEFCHKYAKNQAERYASTNGDLDVKDSSRKDTLKLYHSYAEIKKECAEIKSKGNK